MKRINLTIAATLLALSSGSFAALPVCVSNCDARWAACIKGCAAGSTGQQCKNTCADQHESCLNSCNSGAASIPEFKYRLRELSASDNDLYAMASGHSVSSK